METDARIFAAMQAGEAFATYRKTILGKVSVMIINPFSGDIEGMLLQGDPKTDPKARIDVWSEREDLFFRRMNKREFEIGNIIPAETRQEPEVKSIEQSSDLELQAMMSQPFLSFKKQLLETKSKTVLNRMLDQAKEMEKSEKFIANIEARLAEITAEEYPKIPLDNIVV